MMRLIPRSIALAPFLVLLGSCVGPAPERPMATRHPAAGPAARPASRPAPAATPPAQPAPTATAWQYRAASPGNWTYRVEDAGAVAMFGPSVTDTRLTLRCDRASRRIGMVRAGTGATGGAQGAMIVRTSYGATSWPSTPSNGATPQVVAFRAASDAVLDQLAYSRGKFAVEVAGLEPLILPVWAEVSRVIEDCRG